MRIPSSLAVTARSLALTAGLAVLVLTLAVVAVPGARAQAQAAETATFYGFIAPDDRGTLPIRVRAVGAVLPGHDEPAVCGTADVVASGESAGFYHLVVVSGGARPGCPTAGDDVRFRLLFGAVDPGIEASRLGTWLPIPQRVDLSAVAETVTVGGFDGTFPSGPGYALLRWSGPDHTPVEQAIATIPREVTVVFRLGTRTVQRYVPGAPDFVTDLRTLRTGDFVAVYVK